MIRACESYNWCFSVLFAMCVCQSTGEVIRAQSSQGIVPEAPTAEVRSIATDRGFMIPYTCTIPGTDATFEMIPVPGGEVLLGSPSVEADRKEDEGPQVRIKLEPFWIGKCEITWAEYQAFMNEYEAFKKLEELQFLRDRTESGKKSVEALPKVKQYFDQQATEVDAVTCPTPLYDSSFSYGAGEEPQQPAVTMTQYAAKQYTKWLSGILETHYRLLTEAEWEYAARAGSTTAFCFGDDTNKLGDFAWFDGNAEFQTYEVGTKKPNAWGLHDMHGNVAEWVLDGYDADHYSHLTAAIDGPSAVAWPTKLFPRVIRGGSWLSSASDCRSAARQQSEDPDWTASDPNLPTSPWWFTEDPAMGVGFRIMRPLEPMEPEMRKKVWEADIDRIRQDVTDRLEGGRGAQAAADPRLPGAIENLQESGQIE